MLLSEVLIMRIYSHITYIIKNFRYTTKEMHTYWMWKKIASAESRKWAPSVTALRFYRPPSKSLLKQKHVSRSWRSLPWQGIACSVLCALHITATPYSSHGTEELLFPLFRWGIRLREIELLTQGHTARSRQSKSQPSSKAWALSTTSHPQSRRAGRGE